MSGQKKALAININDNGKSFWGRKRMEEGGSSGCSYFVCMSGRCALSICDKRKELKKGRGRKRRRNSRVITPS